MRYTVSPTDRMVLSLTRRTGRLGRSTMDVLALTIAGASLVRFRKIFDIAVQQIACILHRLLYRLLRRWLLLLPIVLASQGLEMC